MLTPFRPRRVLAHALYGPVLDCTMPLHDTHDTETRVAVKCVSFDAMESVKRESGADRTLDDPIQEARVARLIMDTGGNRNVVQPVCQFHQSTQLCLVTEFCDGGDLYTYASQRTLTSRLQPDEALDIMKQVLAGVHFLHDRLHIAHRDLSLENVLISPPADSGHDDDDGMVFKLSDFALSVPIGSMCDDVAGKYIYMAPEVVARGRYDPAQADVWSLGVMWFILLTGSQLLSLASASNPTLKVIAEHGIEAVLYVWGLDGVVGPATLALLDRMLCVDPAKRISLVSILADPLIKA
jgi:serine/threonine protein kinase